jgi:serine/threonine-protein kinase
MSPEQASGRISAPPSDVFSLGIVLFEMLTGEQPFGQRKPVEVLTHLQVADIASELAPRVDPAYRPLLAAMLRRDPETRLTADEAREQLANFLSG